jgi:hypothetical protein
MDSTLQSFLTGKRRTVRGVTLLAFETEVSPGYFVTGEDDNYIGEIDDHRQTYGVWTVYRNIGTGKPQDKIGEARSLESAVRMLVSDF